MRTAEVAGRAILTVEDSGPGISAADLPHVQDRLYRGSNATGITGSGVGLAVARELVEAHGGTLSIESGERQKGTRAVVTLSSRCAADEGPGHAGA